MQKQPMLTSRSRLCIVFQLEKSFPPELVHWAYFSGGREASGCGESSSDGPVNGWAGALAIPFLYPLLEIHEVLVLKCY